MTFAFTLKNRDDDGLPDSFGRLKIVTGTFTNAGGDTGGDIVTGLEGVYDFILQHTGSAVVADHPAINETMPLITTGTVTIVTTDGADGVWMAIGR